MRKADVFVNNTFSGILTEIEKGKKYSFEYDTEYIGDDVSMTMPLSGRRFIFNSFPPFFDGLLPEGFMLESVLRGLKIDRDDPFSLLVAVGRDMVGNVTVIEIK